MKELGLCIDPAADEISLDGTKVFARENRLYLLLNKPAGYLVTSSDPQGRPTVYDLLGEVKERVFPVGRLDRDTEGLLLFTNDGELAHRLAHPRYGLTKGYWALVSGSVNAQKIKKLLTGIRLEDGRARATDAKILVCESGHSEIYLKLTTGKKRQVRRMCTAIGHPVVRLRRTAFAGLSDEGLPCGQWRHLSPVEVHRLKSGKG